MEAIIDHTSRWPKSSNCHGHLNERCAKTTSEAFQIGKRAPFNPYNSTHLIHVNEDQEVAKITEEENRHTKKDEGIQTIKSAFRKDKETQYKNK